MCGIAGVFEFRPGQAPQPHVLEAMGKVIEHRGPDQGAVFQDGPIGLVARRLRIIDLSPAGSQPDPERGRHDPARLQRRDVQPRGASPGAPGARASLPGALRLGGRRPRLRGVGPALRGALPRVLRVRALGQRPRGAPAGARPDRDQAALLRVVRGPPGLRLGDQGDPRAPGRPPGHGPPVDVPLPGLRVRARAGDHVPGDPEAPAGHHRASPRRPPRDRALLGAPVRGRARRRGDPRPAGPRDAPGLRARVDDVGRPGGRVPLGRARLDGGPGLHARGHDRAAPHLHARLRRSLVQRVGVRARGRALLRDRAPRDPRPPGHARRDRADRLAPRRADDGPLGRAAVPPVPGGAAGRHRLHVGRGRGRGLRRLRSVRRLEGRAILPDAAARAPARGDRAPGHAAPGSGAEEGAGRRPPAVHRRGPPRSGRPPHALAVLRLGRPRRASLPGDRASLGRPGPLRADPPGGRALQLARGSSTARSSWTPGSRCRTRC